ncbi:uncharacterized protein LOC111071704 [Drosophila obscura]|uniref:uncharacterized protein LOC111071704 n=1 Tax=Drosophila obscura TaxID=7282 RepID=UPI001BB0FA7F|nr:uncharacterized protein LOC111071704 [Drosophila obscura]
MSKTEMNNQAPSPNLRTPLWRPVVLHYPKKLLPHGQMRRRDLAFGYPTDYESTKLRCGLAQPHGIDHVRPGQYCPECQCHKDRNHGGGDMADNVSQCSRMSRASKRSVRSIKSKRDNGNGDGDGDNDSPLSQRSDISVKTLISKATLKSGHSKRSPSQETVKSNATVKSSATVKTSASTKSNVSVKSNATVKSSTTAKSSAIDVKYKKSSVRAKASRHSQNEIMPDPGANQHKKETQTQAQAGYENYAPMTSTERKAALEEARFKYDKLIAEYNHLPVSVPTLRVRNRKIDIERELDELDYSINMFDQPNINVYYRR